MEEYDEDEKITTGIRPKQKYRHFKRRGITRKFFLVKPYTLWPDTKQETAKYAEKCRKLGYQVRRDTFGSSGQFAIYAWNQDNIMLAQIADITSILDYQDEERYNWHVKHFPIAKELALYSIELLKRIIEGEQVSIGKMIQEYAISKHNLQLSEGTIRGLRVVRPEGVFPSPFQKMGLNSWMNNWLRIPKEKALMILDQIKERIDALSSMPSEPLPLEPSEFLKIEETVLEDMKSQDYEEELFEGGGKKRYSRYYERNPKLKAATVDCHGTSCMVCGFDFEETYGSHGAGFIEVHHLKPVSELADRMQVDPITDMVVLCANCHRMIHRRKKHILSIDDLRKIRKV